jgi:hypothetical protein
LQKCKNSHEHSFLIIKPTRNHTIITTKQANINPGLKNISAAFVAFVVTLTDANVVFIIVVELNTIVDILKIFKEIIQKVFPMHTCMLRHTNSAIHFFVDALFAGENERTNV